MNYYNEIDPYPAQWLRNLAAAGHIPPGTVDERSIADVRADDLVGFQQVHFFAGIGGWPHALRLAGWPDDRPVWTGSCPCQPFSAAGKGLGEKDERHLWPEFRRLIAESRPSTIFGEQVASAAGRDWLAAVRSDLQALGYAFWAVDLCGASVGAPHIRQRLFWVAHHYGAECGQRSAANGSEEGNEGRGSPGVDAGGRYPSGGSGGMAHAMPAGRPERRPIAGERPATGCGGAGVEGGGPPPPRDHKDTGDLSTSMVRRDGKLRNDTVPRQAHGLTLNTYPAQTESPAQLNPAFSRWLMGYPPEWDACAPISNPRRMNLQ